MQPPKNRHWEKEDDEIRDDVQDGLYDVCEIEIQTFGACHRWVPGGPRRLAVPPFDRKVELPTGLDGRQRLR